MVVDAFLANMPRTGVKIAVFIGISAVAYQVFGLWLCRDMTQVLRWCAVALVVNAWHAPGLPLWHLLCHMQYCCSNNRRVYTSLVSYTEADGAKEVNAHIILT